VAALDAHLLTAVIFAPGGIALALAVLALFGVKLSDALWKVAGLAASAIGFALALLVWQRFDPTLSGMQMAERVPWLEAYGVNYYVGVDGISLLLVVLTAFLLPVILLASWHDVSRRTGQFVFFMLTLQSGMLGAFLSLNLFLFYVFWEVMLIPMYFVIGIWGGPRRVYATVKFFIYTMLGSLLMLVGILVLVWMHHAQYGYLTFDYLGAEGMTGVLDVVIPAGGATWWQTQTWLFLAFGLAFAIKVPMFPFHTWLPDAHVEAPTAGSAVLAGVLLKLGTYGFVRFAMPLFPVASVELAPLVFALGLVGVVYGALVAMVQSDVKKLVAYSSVSHLGFVMVGLFAMNLQGIEGAILQMVNHGISTGALFLLVGMIYERRHVREIREFGGLGHVMPVFGAFFLLTTMSSIGLPLLNGFVGEFLILLGAFARAPWVAVVAATGVILSAVYMLWMVRRVFFGPVVHEVNRRLADLSPRERLVAAALAVPMIWIGVYPATFLRPMDRSVIDLLRTMDRRGALVAPGSWSALVDPGAPLPEPRKHGVLDLARVELAR
jgi:NADH-quinone oxidoreductase subunit M